MSIPPLVPIDELIPKATIEKIERDRATLFGLVAGASEDEVSALLNALDYGPDRVVNLADRDTAVKTQTNPHCTAYATAAAMENVLGGKTDLSVPSLWSLYHAFSTQEAIEAAHQHKVCTIQEWTAHSPGTAQLQLYTYLESDFRKVILTIDSKSPCVVALSVPTEMARGAPQIEDNSSMKHGGHALCVSGYKVEKGRPYFLVKNSWGTSVGEHGYQWVSANLFQLRGYAAFWAVLSVTNGQRVFNSLPM